MKINTDGSWELTVEEFKQLFPQESKPGMIAAQPVPAFAEEEAKYGEERATEKDFEEAANKVTAEIGHNTIACSIWRVLWDSRKQYPQGWTLQELVDCTDFNRASISGALQRLRRMGYVRNVDRQWRAKL